MDRSYSDLHQQVYHRAPATRLTVVSSGADVFGVGRGFMAAFDLTLQLAVGCPAGCLFCYVPAGPGLTPRDLAAKWGDEVRHKERAVEKFGRPLDAGDLADKTIYWSGVTDPYAVPRRLTRPVWEALLAAPPTLRPRRIVVQSRYRVDRDADLIAEYARTTAPSDGGAAVVVSLSVGTDKDDLIRAFERGTPLFGHRMRCVEALRRRQIPVVVTTSPCLFWDDLSGAARRWNALGVSFVTVLFLKEERAEGASTPRPFLTLVRQDPDLRRLLDPAWQADRLGEMRAVFGTERVLVGQPGFAALACPQSILAVGKT